MNMISIARPIISQEEIQEVVKVLKSGNIASGPQVKNFEKEFSEYNGVKQSIAVSNGTIALKLALEAIGIKKEDEIITTPFSFTATSNAILSVGAKPVFADIEENTFNIDPQKISESITKKTKAILGVHLYGLPFNVDKIKKICEENELLLIEDAAQAHGAEYKNKKVGSIGDIACFSFYATKNMTTGEGGMITTNNEDYAKKVRLMINHGQEKRYHQSHFGLNYRLTDIQASIGREQLKKLDENNKKRILLAKKYQNQIKNVIHPFIPENVKHVYHQYTIKLPDQNIRDDLREYLKKNGIDSRVYLPLPIHKQEYYQKRGYQDTSLPVVENTVKKILSIPVHPNLTNEEEEKIIKEINNFF